MEIALSYLVMKIVDIKPDTVLSDFWEDIVRAFNYNFDDDSFLHKRGWFFPEIAQNPQLYVYATNRRRWLESVCIYIFIFYPPHVMTTCLRSF